MATKNITIKVDENCPDQCPWFDAEVIVEKGQPQGFSTWAKKITQCKYKIYLPDETRTSAKLFIDLNKRFNNYTFTNYLLDRYNEL